jgi:hypothetical protein
MSYKLILASCAVALSFCVCTAPATAKTVRFTFGVTAESSNYYGTQCSYLVGRALGNRLQAGCGAMDGITESQGYLGDLFQHLDQTAKNCVAPNDLFIFYINTHAWFDFDGDEPLVQAQYMSNGSVVRVATTGHEYLWLGNTGVRDDIFAAYFSTPPWTSVDKLFIVDSCYAGGFWTGALDQIPRSAFIGASAERDFSYAGPNNEGFVCGLLGQAVADIAPSGTAVELFNWDAFLDSLRNRYGSFASGTSYGVQGVDDFAHNVWGTQLNPSDYGGLTFVSGRTADYRGGTVVDGGYGALDADPIGSGRLDGGAGWSDLDAAELDADPIGGGRLDGGPSDAPPIADVPIGAGGATGSGGAQGSGGASGGTGGASGGAGATGSPGTGGAGTTGTPGTVIILRGSGGSSDAGPGGGTAATGNSGSGGAAGTTAPPSGSGGAGPSGNGGTVSLSSDASTDASTPDAEQAGAIDVGNAPAQDAQTEGDTSSETRPPAPGLDGAWATPADAGLAGQLADGPPGADGAAVKSPDASGGALDGRLDGSAVGNGNDGGCGCHLADPGRQLPGMWTAALALCLAGLARRRPRRGKR